MDQSESRFVAEYCKKYQAGTAKKIIDNADLVCNNCFIFDMPWDLERTGEKVSFDGDIDWYLRLNGDDEFLYQFNRHAFLLHLAQAFLMTYDERYLKQYCKLIKNWISSVPCDNGKRSPWRSLEVAIRAKNWVLSLDLLSEFLDEQLKSSIDDCLKLHRDVLIREHRAFHKGSNWGIIQDSSLFILSQYFNDDNTAGVALTRLEEEIQLQLMNDSVHWEQSCGYHNAVLSELLDVICVAQKNNCIISLKLSKRIENMAFVNLKWIKPNGHHPLFGDSDDNDIRDILTRSALVFNRGDFKCFALENLDYDSAWMLGKDGIEKYNCISKIKPDFTNAYLADSGNYILRQDWSEKSNWLCMHNGYTGGGHAHADKLHFDLMIGGNDFLVDGGRYTYKYTSKRRYLKSAGGHNTTTVGRKGFVVPTDSWSTHTPAKSVQYPIIENDSCVLIEGAHLAYLKSKSVFTSRRILWIKPDIYIVIDEFEGGILEKYNQYFHFAPDGNIKIEKSNVIFNNDEITASMHFVGGKTKVKSTESFYSPNYNAVCSNNAICAKKISPGDCCMITVIHGCEKQKYKNYQVEYVPVYRLEDNKKYNSKTAEAIVIKTDNSEYTVCIAHKELKKVFTANNKLATGIISVYKDDELIFKKW